MAAATDTGGLKYFVNGEPITGIPKIVTGGLTNFVNGEPLITIFPTITSNVNLGAFFLMF